MDWQSVTAPVLTFVLGGGAGGLIVARRESKDRQSQLKLELQKHQDLSNLEREKMREQVRQSRLASSAELVKQTYAVLGRIDDLRVIALLAVQINDSDQVARVDQGIIKHTQPFVDFDKTQAEFERVQSEWRLYAVGAIDRHLSAIGGVLSLFFVLIHVVAPGDTYSGRTPAPNLEKLREHVDLLHAELGKWVNAEDLFEAD